LFGTIKRIYWLLPSLLTDPFDFAERWLKVNYTAPSYMFWILLFIGYLIASVLTYHELREQKRKLEKTNWIDNYQKTFHKLPQIPDFMTELIYNYKPDMIVSKNLKWNTPSTQFWNKLLPSQQDQILELWEWQGYDKRDYLKIMERHAPPRPIF